MISLATTCLALAIYFESRGEPTKGMKYTAHVVMNRADDKENAVCETVFEQRQFSWANELRKLKSIESKVIKAKKRIKETESWEDSVMIASETISRDKDITNGATYFNKRNMGVRFKTNVKPMRIGKHIYY